MSEWHIPIQRLLARSNDVKERRQASKEESIAMKKKKDAELRQKKIDDKE